MSVLLFRHNSLRLALMNRSRRHSIAAALFLPADQLHQFDDIGYRHNPYTHCPSNPKYKASGKCACDPKESFDNDGYSCMRCALFRL